MNPQITKILKIKFLVENSAIKNNFKRSMSLFIKGQEGDLMARNALFHDIFKIGLLKIFITPAPNAGLDQTFSRFCLML